MTVSFHPPFSLAFSEISKQGEFFLSDAEKVLSRSFCESRRREFASGRFAARLAAVMFRPFYGSFSDLVIEYGSSGQPVTDCGLFVSITHDSGFASALCWNDEDILAGTDIHHISDEAFRTRSCWLSDEEKGILDFFCNSERSCSLAWCAKESTSKAIKLGLKAFRDIVIYDIYPFNDSVICGLKYGQTVFKAHLYEENGFVISLCFDEKSSEKYESSIAGIINDLKGVMS